MFPSSWNDNPILERFLDGLVKGGEFDFIKKIYRKLQRWRGNFSVFFYYSFLFLIFLLLFFFFWGFFLLCLFVRFFVSLSFTCFICLSVFCFLTFCLSFSFSFSFVCAVRFFFGTVLFLIFFSAVGRDTVLEVAGSTGNLDLVKFIYKHAKERWFVFL